MKKQWLEMELEDFIVNNPRELFGAHFMYGSRDCEIGFLGRQVECAFGIIDLIYYATIPESYHNLFQIYIIELKAVTANRKTIEQAERYRHAVNQLNLYELMPDNDFGEYGRYLEDHIEVTTLLVAPSFSADIDWYHPGIVAEKSNNGFSFSPKPYNHRNPDMSPLAQAIQPVVNMATAAIKNKAVSKRIRHGLNAISARDDYDIRGN